MHEPDAASHKSTRLPSGDLDYPFTQPALGEVLEVAPGIWWVCMPLPLALKHINLWLLADGDGWTVVDTGYNVAENRDAWLQVMDTMLGGRKLKRMIVTHFHPDHVGLAGWMAERWGPELWMTYGEWMTALQVGGSGLAGKRAGWTEFFVSHGLPPERISDRREGYSRGATPVPQVFRRICDGQSIDIGGRQWQVIVCGGHSPEHVSLYAPELGVLISGDQVLPRITTNVSVLNFEPDGDPLGLFLRSFARFRPLPADTLVLPSHNRPFYGLHRRLDYLVAHHGERLAATLAACERASSAFELLPILFKRTLDDADLGFAMGESVAHLNHLYLAGKLRRTAPADGPVLFQTIA